MVFDPNDKSPVNISIWENKDRVRIQYKSEGSEWTVTFYGTAIEKWDLEVPKSTNKDTSNAYICVANNCFEKIYATEPNLAKRYVGCDNF